MNGRMFRNVMKMMAAAIALSATSAWAGPIGDTGQFNQTRLAGYYSGNGGEFTVYGFGSSLSNAGYGAQTRDQDPAGDPVTAPGFQTFCIEFNEFTGGDPTYFKVNSAAVEGGVSGGNPDPISKGTAWLYSQFAAGTLAGYDYTVGGAREAAALALQHAIWYLEGEGGAANAFYDAAVAAVGAGNEFADAEVGEYGVYVLNTYATADHDIAGKRQDFLYRVPDGGTTVALFGAVLAGLGALKRTYRI